MRVLTDNFIWKVASLAIAICLWFAFVEHSEVAASLAAPVHFRNVPRDAEISSEVPDRLQLKLRGPASRLRASDLGSVSVVLDLGLAQRLGERTFTLSESNMSLPPGVKLTGVTPSQVRLKLEKTGRRVVPVEARFAGPPPLGYRLTQSHVKPDSLAIAGPESRVVHLKSVSTDAIDLSTTVSDTEFRVPAYVGEAQLRFETSPIVAVRVSVEKIR